MYLYAAFKIELYSGFYKISGKNIGYGSTSECMVQAAMVLLQETSKLPGEGGVLTPGYAFANTTLVDRLKCARRSF